MLESVEATFRYTRDEYVRAIRLHCKTNLQFKRDMFASIVGIVAGVSLLWLSDWLALAWLLIIGGSCLLGMVGYIVLFLPDLVYRSEPKLKTEYRLQFRDDGIAFRTDEIDSTLKWSLYHSWLRDDEFYILFHGKRGLFPVPRRALVGPRDERFAELLRHMVGPSVTSAPG